MVANDSGSIKVFSDTCDLKNIIKEPTCYRNLNNPSCIDLILTNKPQSFQQSRVIEADSSVFCKIKTTVLKTLFEKLQPIVAN